MRGMALILTVLILVAGLAAAGGCREDAEEILRTRADTAAVEAVLVSYGEARTASDVDTFVALHDPEALKMPQDRPAFVFPGADPVRMTWEREDAVSTVEMEVVPEETVVMDDFAYTRGTYTKRSTPIEGGGPSVFEGKFLTVLRKDAGGNWVIYRDSYSANTPPPSPPPQYSFGTPVNLGSGINGEYLEGSPVVSSDGLELYFHSNRPGGSGGFDLWMASRSSVDGKWGDPVNLGAAVNSQAHEIAPTLSADGRELYFSDFINVRGGGQGKSDIWVTTRDSKNGDWGVPVNLGPTVNTAGEEITPEISADGLELYFETDRPGGLGSDDLWVARRSSPRSDWGEPEWLGEKINTAGMDHCPTLTSDGLTLFYDCTPPGGTEVGDLMIVRRADVGQPWGDPINLGRPHSGHYAGDISADGSTLYYTSAAPGGHGGADIWMVPISSWGAQSP